MKVYHGTSTVSWTKDPDGGSFYVTASPLEADTYAEEAVISDAGDLPEEEWNTVQRLIFEFDLEQIEAWANSGEISLEPDWGWQDGFLDDATPDWKSSLEAVGSFSISNFQEHHKQAGVLLLSQPVEEETVAPAP